MAPSGFLMAEAQTYAEVPCRVPPSTGRSLGARIWIDLDNTPHVPFFIPVIRELERRGPQVILSARDAFQVFDLADQKGLRYARIGRHYGKNPIMKLAGVV